MSGYSILHRTHYSGRQLDRAIVDTLHHKARAFEIQLSDCGLQTLGKVDAFRFFRRLVNYDADTVAASPLVYDTHLDYFVADSAVEMSPRPSSCRPSARRCSR